MIEGHIVRLIIQTEDEPFTLKAHISNPAFDDRIRTQGRNGSDGSQESGTHIYRRENCIPSPQFSGHSCSLRFASLTLQELENTDTPCKSKYKNRSQKVKQCTNIVARHLSIISSILDR